MSDVESGEKKGYSEVGTMEITEAKDGEKAEANLGLEGTEPSKKGGLGIADYYTEFTTSLFRPEPPASVIVPSESYGIFGPLAPLIAYADNYFRITDRGSSFYVELRGGLTTFLSMCYIMVLNGVIIAGPFNTGMSVEGVFFATTLSSGIFTFLMGLLVNVPVALAPGMGLNGFFATVAKPCAANPTGVSGGVECPGWGESSLPWNDAMGAVFLSGIIYIFLTFTGMRAMLFKAVPPSLRAAISVGIGFFITRIGVYIGQIGRVTVQSWAINNVYKAGGNTLIVSSLDHGSGYVACNNPVDLFFNNYDLGIVKFNLNPAARVAIVGITFVLLFEFLKIKGSIIFSIICATLVGINYVHCISTDHGTSCVTDLSIWNQKGGPDYIVNTHDIPSGHLTFKYAHKPFFWSCVFTFLFVEMFDSFGTLTGIMMRCGFFDSKDPADGMSKVNKAMMIDGFGLAVGGIIGANSITCFVESTTGVAAGARTGFASLITGSCFLLSLLFVYPFVEIIPDAATTCALIMVGIQCFVGVKDINFKDIIDQAAAFLTIATMGFTYSIANGICAGFIFFPFMRTGRWVMDQICTFLSKNVSVYNKIFGEYARDPELEYDLPHPLMFIMGAFCVIRFKYLNA